MRKILFALILMAVPIMASAQTDDDDFVPVSDVTDNVSTLRFGYLSYSAAMKQLPEYATAQTKIAELRTSYQREMDRSRDEFNLKYETFLDEQASLVPSIRRKRQVELEDILNSNKAFREEARRLLEQSEAEALQPVRQKLNRLIAQVARQQGLAFVINTDNDACPYIDTALGTDISTLVINSDK